MSTIEQTQTTVQVYQVFINAAPQAVSGMRSRSPTSR